MTTTIEAQDATGHPEPTFTIELITPDLAREWLLMNQSNRPIRPHALATYTRVMKEGLWRSNGEGIIFGWDGSLLNGQHRLKAVIASGVTIECLVVRNIDPATFDTLDLGAKRSFSDVLSLTGEGGNSGPLATACAYLWRYERGAIQRSGPPTPSTPELEIVLQANPGLRDSVTATVTARRFIPHGLAAALHYLFMQKEPLLADEFFLKLVDGSGLSARDPIWLLRERFIRDRDSKARLIRPERLALIIKAWNLARHRREVGTLRWTARSEAFPEIE